ncbi:hypothetical protein GLAREA_12833 [Glarea lozoyensis ATCC 20868]|uniref:Nucleotide-diphospho-sugar transferase n=1 Tax=Glarea lozoyensis (strain ATCC 20868 / MF5171) TaxID=1116229 RepID=S3CWS6_GLAL2|nr:uncharacterized protein GLAREA_12833 [Glarea lozoyensis ATCC 20868]EPE30110.1 hypothetical protein GLAREA_12833 [Glarea lozoyensis ATCC 20868]
MSFFPRILWLRRTWLRLVVPLLFFVLSIDLFLTVAVHPQPKRVSAIETVLTNISNPRIFIASIHWNNEVAIRSHWGVAVLDLVRYLGPENVYISILESCSWDGSKDALRELDLQLEELGVQRSIELLESTHKDDIERTPKPGEEGWIWTKRGRKELRRIPYLAGMRNQLMKKLNDLAEDSKERKGQRFERVLWLNDVVFTTEDVITLIATRNGNYAAACSLDFLKPPSYYDTFALRDIFGDKTVTRNWPYFLASQSRKELISNDPVPVKSCWNGIAVFKTDPFYDNPPLRFRGISDSLATYRLEGSECCLIHIDNRLSSKLGVWLNPNVKVAYNTKAYMTVNPEIGSWPKNIERVQGIWHNRLARWSGFPGRFLEEFTIGRKIRLWRDVEGRKEKDELHNDEHYCMVSETQVVVENGWAHL